MKVQNGLDLMSKKWPRRLKGSRAGLLCNPASVSKGLDHAADIFSRIKEFRLRAMFGPQHGIRGETQDNMVEWKGFKDKRTGLPVHSLYSRTRKPAPATLKDIDAFVIDIQDIGARYYTFIWTMELCMQACLEAGKTAVVLDRPNPITGRTIEGPVLDSAFSSFVGLRPLPVRHGMTAGEIAVYLKEEFYPGLDLHVIKMSGWKRKMWFDDTGLPWVVPSPNMPTPETALVYPGMCLLEGTNLSEGRGTTRPFEIFGAPFIDADRLVGHLKRFRLPAVVFRPMHFQPTFQKHKGKLCGGAQIHVTSRERFQPFKTGVAVLKAVHDLYPEYFKWKRPPYEYETEKLPIDILAGTDRLRKDIEKGRTLGYMEKWWTGQVRKFDRNIRKKYLLYK